MKPRHIIFFTGPQYDDYIESLDFGFNENKIIDKGKQKKIIDNMPNIWWERNIINEEKSITLKTLRTYHPDYFKRIHKNDSFKNSFVEYVVNWIKKP